MTPPLSIMDSALVSVSPRFCMDRNPLDTASEEESDSETVLVMPAILDTASDEVSVSERV